MDESLCGTASRGLLSGRQGVDRFFHPRTEIRAAMPTSTMTLLMDDVSDDSTFPIEVLEVKNGKDVPLSLVIKSPLPALPQITLVSRMTTGRKIPDSAFGTHGHWGVHGPMKTSTEDSVQFQLALPLARFLTQRAESTGQIRSIHPHQSLNSNVAFSNISKTTFVAGRNFWWQQKCYFRKVEFI